MAKRNTAKLKELISTKLSSDSALNALLGGSGKVKQGNYNNLSEYPGVTWDIPGGLDEPYNPDKATGIVKSFLAVEILTAEENEDSLGPIEDRVYELLHGQNLSNADIIVYSCYRKTRVRLPEIAPQVWRVRHKYELVNAPVPS